MTDLLLERWTDMDTPDGGAAMTRRLLAGANVLMLLAFAFSVIVQVNDPDPVLWISVYGAAALGCALALLGRGHWSFFAAVAGVAAGWAAGIAPRVAGRVPFLDMFGAFEMESLAVEESREMYGLLIVAVWMAVLAVAAWRRARESDGPGGTGDPGGPSPGEGGDR